MAIAQLQSIKEQIIQDLEPLSLEGLQQVLAYVQQLNPEAEPVENSEDIDEQAWQAYLKSETEYAEVYRRLAES